MAHRLELSEAALIEGGATAEQASTLAAESGADLAEQGVTAPTRYGQELWIKVEQTATFTGGLLVFLCVLIVVASDVTSTLALTACSPLARRESPCAIGDALGDSIEVTENLVLGHPQHIPTEVTQRSVSRAIVTPAQRVVLPIDLDHQAHLGAREVDDVLADDELTTEREPGLRPAEPAPEPLLRACG